MSVYKCKTPGCPGSQTCFICETCVAHCCCTKTAPQRPETSRAARVTGRSVLATGDAGPCGRSRRACPGCIRACFGPSAVPDYAQVGAYSRDPDIWQCSAQLPTLRNLKGHVDDSNLVIEPSHCGSGIRQQLSICGGVILPKWRVDKASDLMWCPTIQADHAYGPKSWWTGFRAISRDLTVRLLDMSMAGLVELRVDGVSVDLLHSRRPEPNSPVVDIDTVVTVGRPLHRRLRASFRAWDELTRDVTSVMSEWAVGAGLTVGAEIDDATVSFAPRNLAVPRYEPAGATHAERLPHKWAGFCLGVADGVAVAKGRLLEEAQGSYCGRGPGGSTFVLDMNGHATGRVEVYLRNYVDGVRATRTTDSRSCLSRMSRDVYVRPRSEGVCHNLVCDKSHLTSAVSLAETGGNARDRSIVAIGCEDYLDAVSLVGDVMVRGPFNQADEVELNWPDSELSVDDKVLMCMLAHSSLRNYIRGEGGCYLGSGLCKPRPSSPQSSLYGKLVLGPIRLKHCLGVTVLRDSRNRMVDIYGRALAIDGPHISVTRGRATAYSAHVGETMVSGTDRDRLRDARCRTPLGGHSQCRAHLGIPDCANMFKPSRNRSADFVQPQPCAW